MTVIPSNKATAEWARLLAPFDSTTLFKDVVEVAPDQLPEPYRQLLDHHSHMTVALENFHKSSVDLHVLAAHDERNLYSRKIALSRSRDGHIVLFGLVRLDPSLLPSQAMQEIREQREPLGRILIRHDVMREVERLRLWQITPASELRELFRLTDGRPLYGRTALIHCNGRPAIELLELVLVELPSPEM
jgi:chorismate-pyruvate lyase